MRRASRIWLSSGALALLAVLVPAAPVGAQADGTYQPLSPARILDTRSGVGAAGPVGPGGSIDVDVTGVGGVPDSGVGAVVLNVTATNPSEATFVTVWPTGQPRPDASNLNVVAGQSVPNLVIATVGAGGKVSLYNYAGTVDLIADVSGWFPAGAEYNGLTPNRILDTRTSTPVEAGGSIDVQVTGVGGVPEAGVGAVVINVTATNPTAATFVTVWPTGAARPEASNLNVVAGQSVPNLVIATVGDGGRVSLFNYAGNVDLVADVAGWFPAGASYGGLTPARILDTRTSTPVGAGGSIDVQVTGVGTVPASGVGAVVLNVTATNPTEATFVTAWPTGQPRPEASNLNVVAGQSVPNLVIATVGAGGKVSLYNYAGTTDLIADVMGWFPGATPPPQGANVGDLYFTYLDGLGTVDMATRAEVDQVHYAAASVPYSVNAPQHEFVYNDDEPRVHIRDLTSLSEKDSFVWDAGGSPAWSVVTAPEASPDATLVIAQAVYDSSVGPEYVEVVDRAGNLVARYDPDVYYDWAWTPTSDLMAAVDTTVAYPGLEGDSALFLIPRSEIPKGAQAQATVIKQYTGALRRDHLSVSPDGAQVAYQYDNNLYVMALQAGADHHFLAYAPDPVTSSAFSPDSSHLALIAPHVTGPFGRQGPIQVIPNHRGPPLDVSDGGPYQLHVAAGVVPTVDATSGLAWTA